MWDFSRVCCNYKDCNLELSAFLLVYIIQACAMSYNSTTGRKTTETLLVDHEADGVRDVENGVEGMPGQLQ